MTAPEVDQAKQEVLRAIELLAAFAEDRAVNVDVLEAAALARSFVLSETTPLTPLSSRRRADAGTPSSSTRALATAAGQGNPS